MSAIVTIGNFDGVHLGHQVLLKQVVDRAHVLGLRSFAITFDPHPERILVPNRRLLTLTDAAEKERLIRASGIDDVWTCPFTLELSRLGPEEFMHLVSERQPIAELWVGADFALGRGRSGTISVLADIGGHSGWGLHMVPPYRLNGQVVSSTAIRTLLAAGTARAVADILGRPYSASGDLSFESDVAATLTIPGDRALPRGAQYGAEIRQGDQAIDAVVTVPPSQDQANPPPSALQVSFTHPTQLASGPASVAFLSWIRPADELDARPGWIAPT